MEWYYANDGQRSGPINIDELARHVAMGVVHDSTLVWCAGMTEWKTWAEVAPTVQLPTVATLPPPVPTTPNPLGAPVPGAGSPFTAGPAAEYGGFWMRFLAKLIDGVILAIIGNIIGMVFLAGNFAELQRLDPEDPAAMAQMFSVLGRFILISTVVGLAYHWTFLAAMAATPGKLALGLRIVRADGSRLSHGRIVGRFFAEYLSSFIIYIGYIIAAFDDQKRTLHDYVCDTRVIKKR
ncbi:MAG TPA: RDD family protein [Candidatus Synoicihabitans sp.]|nr:RDD family protein [Candidatus Synoicihabitans sp.]